MKLQKGDKVKFLNDHGGGIVSKVISSSLVHVKIEDGFEIPTLVNELVKVEETGQRAAHFFMDKSRATVGDYEEDADYRENVKEEKPVYDDRSKPLEIFKAKGNDKKGVYLAYVPQDQKWLLTGLMDIYLVNFSEYDVLFSLLLRKPNGAWEGVDYDVAKPNTRILLDSIERDHIEKWSYGMVQLLYHKNLSSKVLLPANCTFSFKPAKLYLEKSYHESSFISGKSYLLMLNETAVQPSAAEAELSEKFDDEIKMQHAQPKKPEEVINKHKTSPREATVDLHIGELVEDYSKMSPSEMLNYQLNYFVRCLESAITNYLTKVTFIHGVGDGVLKSKMMDILREYDNIRVKDASLKKFGYGATEVLIWHSNFVE